MKRGGQVFVQVLSAPRMYAKDWDCWVMRFFRSYLFFTLIKCESVDALACPSLFPPCGVRNQSQVIGIVSKSLYRLRWGLFLTSCGASMLLLRGELACVPPGTRGPLFPRSLRHLLSSFSLTAAFCGHWAVSHSSFHLHTYLVDGFACFLSLLAICVSSEKRLTLSLNVLKVMQTGEMKKETKARLHTNFLPPISLSKPCDLREASCCPVIVPGAWAVRRWEMYFLMPDPSPAAVSFPLHCVTVTPVTALNSFWPSECGPRIMSSRNCLPFSSLSSRVKADLSVRKEGYKVRWAGGWEDG